jgi:hypothetical protein
LSASADPWAWRVTARSQEHVEGALGDAEPAHAVVDAARAEPLLGDQEARAARAEQRVGRHAHVLVAISECPP